MRKTERETLQKRVVSAYRRAYDTSPYHRRVFKRAGLDRDSLRTLEDIDRVPLTTGRDFSAMETQSEASRIAVQVEPHDWPSAFLMLTAQDLQYLAEILADIWSRAGVVAGDRVLIYDYGSSVSTFPASKNFTSHLKRGATELLNCTVSCNDGLPDYAARAEYMASFIRPKLIVIRKDCLPLFSSHLRSRRVALKEYGVAAVAVVEDEDYLKREELEAYGAELGIKLVTILRADRAIFVASGPGGSGGIDVDPEYYYAEVLDGESGDSLGPQMRGRLVITNLFSRGTSCIRYATAVPCSFAEADRNSSFQHITLEGQ